MKRIIRFVNILFAMIALAAIQVSAQTIKIKGRVSDIYNVGMPGVSVTIEGSSQGVVTDLDGIYEVEASSKDVLLFSCMGFVNQTLKIDGRSRVNVVIRESGEYMDPSLERVMSKSSEDVSIEDELDRMNLISSLMWSNYSTIGARP